jgi:hypothetical protein
MLVAVFGLGLLLVGARGVMDSVIVSKSRRILANTRVANDAIVEHRRRTERYPQGDSVAELVAKLPSAKMANEWNCTYMSDGIKYRLECPAYKGESFLFSEGRLISYPKYLKGRLHPTGAAPN